MLASTGNLVKAVIITSQTSPCVALSSELGSLFPDKFFSRTSVIAPQPGPHPVKENQH